MLRSDSRLGAPDAGSPTPGDPRLVRYDSTSQKKNEFDPLPPLHMSLLSDVWYAQIDE